MYLVDTSVWLDFFRGRESQPIVQFEEMLGRGIPYGLTGLIFQEVLQGVDSEDDFAKLSTYLSTQKFYDPVDPVDSYRSAANLYFRCRRRGVTVRSTADCLIAQIAIEHGLLLLHNDRDFVQMARVVRQLRLA